MIPAIICFPVFVLVLDSKELTSGNVGILNYFKTYALWLFYYIFFILAFIPIKKGRENLLYPTLKSLKFCTISIFILVVFQVVFFKFTGDTSLFLFWGENSYASQDYVIESIIYGSSKATGFYLEPAMLGLVSICLIVAITNITINYLQIFMLGTVTFLSGSAAAILTLLAFSILFIIKHKESKINIKPVLFILLLILLFLVFPYLFLRAETIFIEGTSVYYRLIAPLEPLKDVLLSSPFGVSFGLMEETLLSYRLENGVNDGTTIDNGWYLLVFYFGWLGLIVSVIIFFILGKFIVKGDLKLSLLSLYFLLSPLFTGAIFSPEFLFLQFIVLISYRFKNEFS
jgi:putative colanic acid polymerase